MFNDSFSKTPTPIISNSFSDACKNTHLLFQHDDVNVYLKIIVFLNTFVD